VPLGSGDFERVLKFEESEKVYGDAPNPTKL